jgi:hypothetical protein
VISLLKGEATAAAAAGAENSRGGTVTDRFPLRAENAQCAPPKEGEALSEEKINRLKRKMGELTIDVDVLLEAAPYDAGDVRRMATWPAASKRRVCWISNFSRARVRAGSVIAPPSAVVEEAAGRKYPTVDRSASTLYDQRTTARGEPTFPISH